MRKIAIFGVAMCIICIILISYSLIIQKEKHLQGISDEQFEIDGFKETMVTASSDSLLGKYERGDRLFKKYVLNDRIVYWHQRMIDDAIVEFDYIRYEFDKNTKELIEKDIHWRSGLPEHVTTAITKEQAESMVRGEVQFTDLYIISPDSDVFPLKPTPQNPCWVVRSVDNGNVIVTIIDAIDGKVFGYGIPPPVEFSSSNPKEDI